MRGLIAGVVLEFRIARTEPHALIPLFTAPLFAVIFLLIVRQAERSDLQSDALIAPVLVTFWWVALQHAGHLITGDRYEALLEPLITTPTSFGSVLFGRVLALMGLALISTLEVWAVGRFGFGVSIPFEHPGALALTLLATALATAGTSVAFAAVFVLTRNAYTFTNSLSFPLYLLGGVFVPVTLLPSWIQPVSRVVFMSWSADLMRSSVREPPISDFWPRLAMILVLGGAAFLLGQRILFLVLRRMRVRGELATA